MTNTRIISVTIHARTWMVIARLAFLSSYQVRGWMPVAKKTTLIAELTHTTLMANRNPAPKARLISPRPDMRPSVTPRRSNATATTTSAGTPNNPGVFRTNKVYQTNSLHFTRVP